MRARRQSTHADPHAPGGRQGLRRHPGRRRPAQHHVARAAWRGGDQAGAARRRLGAHARQDLRRPVRPFRRVQPRQEIAGDGHEEQGRAGGRLQAGLGGRCRGRELPPRRDGALRHRLRAGEGRQSGGHLPLGHGLRPTRPLQPPSGDRFGDPGVFGVDVDQSRHLRHAATHRHDRHRRDDRALRLPGHLVGAAAQVPFRQGRLYRLLADAVGGGVPVRQGHGALSGRRRAAGALCAGRHDADRRWLHQRHRHARTPLCLAVQGSRAPRSCRRPALRRAREAHRTRGGADAGHPGRVPEAHDRGMGRGADGGRRDERPGLDL